MGTLLLRLASPLQSWGTDSKFETRRTDDIPSKSGVIGLLAAALGRRRDEPVDDLAGLRFGVRVDQPGTLLRDFHIAQIIDEKNPDKKDAYVTYPSYRFYLSDAIFLVGLESEDLRLLNGLDAALRHPVFPLYLGRRSCPPTLPLSLGVRETDLGESLSGEPWLTCEWLRKHLDSKLRTVYDAEEGEPGCRMTRDLPISYNPVYRKLGFRLTRDGKRVDKGAERGDVNQVEVFDQSIFSTQHDAMKGV